MPGMSVVAEIKTDKRRIIDYVLSPIREYQAEAMRENNHGYIANHLCFGHHH